MSVEDLLEKVAAQERAAEGAEVLAPVVAGGRVRASVGGLVKTFTTDPAGYEGIGVFRLEGDRAVHVEDASKEVRARFLGALAQLRLILVRPLSGRSWLAVPAEVGDFAQRVGPPLEQRVHLVEGASELDVVRAAYDGAAFWSAGRDPRVDPQRAEKLRLALGRGAPWADTAGGPPALARAYALASNRAARRAYEGRRRDRAQIEEALEVTGGTLRDFRDEGDQWVVEWSTDDGRRQTSWVDKEDLDVEGPGVSLEGQQRELDLRSLRGVVERAFLDGEVVEFD
jgi:hypothetical protein